MRVFLSHAFDTLSTERIAFSHIASTVAYTFVTLKQHPKMRSLFVAVIAVAIACASAAPAPPPPPMMPGKMPGPPDPPVQAASVGSCSVGPRRTARTIGTLLTKGSKPAGTKPLHRPSVTRIQTMIACAVRFSMQSPRVFRKHVARVIICVSTTKIQQEVSTNFLYRGTQHARAAVFVAAYIGMDDE